MIKYFFPPKGFVVVENFFKPEEQCMGKRAIFTNLCTKGDPFARFKGKKLL
jgi:hypothetical protein